MMEPSHIGAYILLLAQCWSDQRCSLPSDPGVLQKLSKWDETRYGSFETVLQCFVPLGHTGRLTNRRLYEEWQAARQRFKQWSRGGQRGAETRWKTQSLHSRADGLPSPRRNGKTAFPLDWKPTAEELDPWRRFGINPAIEFAAFRDHAKSIDRRLTDWPAGFRNWCRKAIQLKGGKS